MKTWCFSAVPWRRHPGVAARAFASRSSRLMSGIPRLLKVIEQPALRRSARRFRGSTSRLRSLPSSPTHHLPIAGEHPAHRLVLAVLTALEYAAELVHDGCPGLRNHRQHAGYVLHAERARLHLADQARELEHERVPRVHHVAPARHRVTLARRSADHEVKLAYVEPDRLENLLPADLANVAEPEGRHRVRDPAMRPRGHDRRHTRAFLALAHLPGEVPSEALAVLVGRKSQIDRVRTEIDHVRLRGGAVVIDAREHVEAG